MANLGLQLYTVRDHLEKDFEGTLRKVAELGYKGVEFAGYYGRTPGQVSEILKETGLSVIGAHTSYDRLRNALEEEIAFNKAIGNQYLIFPFLAEDERDRWPEVIEDLKAIGKRCAAAGLGLLYHNHEFELTETLDGQPVLDAIYERVAPELLQVELDSCWVTYAGFDPLAYIAKYSGRIPLLHLKDIVKKEDGSAETVELGRGIVDIKAIADAAVADGVKWIIVEQDYCAGDSLDSIAVSMEWIKGYVQEGGKINV
ncbi:sugar phosphate isomerase/epimerase family protein [Paenibacillus woosongensis]|uniref:TIM barrel protein n=1 Tax=Paenibacillus woosongensis TaxID=307580 RepID=A0A7X3CNC2_9BACL|nr:sugar phosphate isomerase/epimerase [Paenibacillus woosongensis]MUG44835.1 TIM barrel protein [Paenibacillus woosongensis]